MLRLEAVNEINIWRIVELKVRPDQEHFVATNTQSILEAYVTQQSDNIALPYGIYDDETLVGFVMLGYGVLDDNDPEIAKDNYLLWRFMIDEHYQRKGYGRRALDTIFEHIKTWPVQEANACWVSYEPDNDVVRKLYASFGFVENGEFSGDEVVAVMEL